MNLLAAVFPVTSNFLASTVLFIFLPFPLNIRFPKSTSFTNPRRRLGLTMARCWLRLPICSGEGAVYAMHSRNGKQNLEKKKGEMTGHSLTYATTLYMMSFILCRDLVISDALSIHEQISSLVLLSVFIPGVSFIYFSATTTLVINRSMTVFFFFKPAEN